MLLFAGDNLSHPHLFKMIDVKAAHVNYPSQHILLCGGPLGEASNDSPMPSMRGVFWKYSHHKPFSDYDVILAEHVSKDFSRWSWPGTYDDLLSLESDLAQVSSIILLFSESFGSAVELGAFCWDKDISKRLLIVISERHYRDDSFVKLGPLKRLKDDYGESVVCVIPRDIWDERDICKAEQKEREQKYERLMDCVKESFRKRVESISKKTTFNIEYMGHVTLFFVGIVCNYSSLTLPELQYIALGFDFKIDEYSIRKAMLLCNKV